MDSIWQIINRVVTILSFIVSVIILLFGNNIFGISRLERKIDALEKITYPLTTVSEGGMYFFDNNKSSLKVINIDLKKQEVTVAVNLRGQIKNETLITNKTTTYVVDNGDKLNLILKGVQEKENRAEFVVTKLD